MTTPIRFLATFPAIQSAIKVTGDGGGMRIQFDVPESEMAEAVKLLSLRQEVLVITVERHERKEDHHGVGAVKRTAAKQRE